MIWSAFILGLFGSLHCAGMCGPLALALPQAAADRMHFVLGRLAYNLGRLATYCLLGLISGAAGRVFQFAGVQRWVSIALGVLLLAGLMTSRRLALSRPVIALVARLKAAMSQALRQRNLMSLGVLGLLNGLLPCGLVYVAMAAAAMAGGAWAGVVAMAAFGAGTIPMMLAISLSGHLLPVSFRLRLAKAVPAAVLCLGCLLILRGLSLGIPYLSPELSTAGTACCHH